MNRYRVPLEVDEARALRKSPAPVRIFATLSGMLKSTKTVSGHRR